MGIGVTTALIYECEKCQVSLAQTSAQSLTLGTVELDADRLEVLFLETGRESLSLNFANGAVSGLFCLCP